MHNKYQGWDGDKIVTIVVLVAWLLMWIVPVSIRVSAERPERKARELDEAAFFQDKPKMMETMKFAYEAVRDGNAAAFDEIVDIDSFLVEFKKEYPYLKKQDVLNAINEKKFIDPNATFGIKVHSWTLMYATPENTFYKFIKYSDGKNRTVEKYSKTIGSQREYLVESIFQAHGYKKSTLRLSLKERDGRFYISYCDRDYGTTSLINYYSKLAILNRSQTWDEAEANAAGTIKWQLGQPRWDSPDGRIILPVEIEAIERNLVETTLAAQIVDAKTGQVVGRVNIYAWGKFIAGKNVSSMGGSNELDAALLRLLNSGLFRIGKIVPVMAYEGSNEKYIYFSEKLGVHDL